MHSRVSKTLKFKWRKSKPSERWTFWLAPQQLSSWHSFLPFSTTIIHSKKGAQILLSHSEIACNAFLGFLARSRTAAWESNMGGFFTLFVGRAHEFPSSRNALWPSLKCADECECPSGWLGGRAGGRRFSACVCAMRRRVCLLLLTLSSHKRHRAGRQAGETEN